MEDEIFRKETGVTKEEQSGQIQALLQERRGYEVHGQTDRVKEVDKELKRLGAAAEKPSSRAQKRPESKAADKR